MSKKISLPKDIYNRPRISKEFGIPEPTLQYQYHNNKLPKPDGYNGKSPYWLPETIIAFYKSKGIRKIKRVDSRRIDLKGQQFGELTVIQLSEKRDKHNVLLWECKCSCGETSYVAGISLRAGHYKSCGCKKLAKRDEGVKRHIESDKVDGTRKSALKAKLHKDNKSGIKGVRWNESRQKWTAHIGYKGKQVSLGYFVEKEEAIEARRKAEDKYHKPYLDEER
ncbi:AP2 domain-containing protein [Paenibacillus agilis]|uniref:AP2 domain-containing protein n=2 Tax=Paenibacillus agilis TaxID=3020863 RepID=A0A559IDE2_9BACL|nr:AP2 domain-containing protein [Paenibacillus agilis]